MRKMANSVMSNFTFLLKKSQNRYILSNEYLPKIGNEEKKILLSNVIIYT